MSLVNTRRERDDKPLSPPRAPSRRQGTIDTDMVMGIVAKLRLVTAPTRLMILFLLAEHERNVGAICSELDNSSQPSVSHQLALLRHGRLIEARREGRTIVYSLTPVGQTVTDAFRKLA